MVLAEKTFSRRSVAGFRTRQDPMNKNTAISRKKPSAPIQFLDSQGLLKGRLLDFGCGRGFDAKHYGMAAYDPHWSPDPVVLEAQYDTIVCNYVLNVVEPEEEQSILTKVASLLSPAGSVYFAVRRDIPRTGQRGRGCWQRWVDLKMPILVERKGFAIYKMSGKKSK